MNFRKLFLSSLSLLCIASCKQTETVLLHVQIKDDLGKQVPEALVLLNGSELGYSDENGALSLPLELKKGEHRIEVSKDLDPPKYANFKYEFLVYSSKEKDVNIDATLYTSPAWASETNLNSTAPRLSSNQAPSTEADQFSEVPQQQAPAKSENVLTSTEKPPIARESTVTNYQEEIQSLEKVPGSSPSYIKSLERVAEIYFKKINNPKKALEVFDRLTRLPKIKSYKNPDYIGLYLDKAICYYSLAEKTQSLNERVKFYRNTLWISKQVSALLNKEKLLQQYGESTYYYRALSLHRIWALSPSSSNQLAKQVDQAWSNYQQISKQIKKNVFYSRSESYRKQVSL